MANLYYKSGNEWLPLGGGSLPVGSYVYSDNNVSPAADMGGIWQSLGYTAVVPVVIKDSHNSSGHFDSDGRIYYVIQHYNYITGYIGMYSGNHANGNFENILPLSNITAFSDTVMVDTESWYYGPEVTASITTNPSGTFGSKYPQLPYDSGDNISLWYTTDESLPTSVSGGKYLFKRIA